jgi:tetratricopeptide (TPR) repeat protein
LKPNNHNSRQKLTLTLLLLLAMIVIGLLPKIVSEPWIVETNQTSVSQSSNTTVSPSTAAEKTKYRQDAQLLLADIIRLRDSLSNQAVKLWARLRFEQALLAIEQGDQQYGNGEYQKSIASYQGALDDLNELNTQSTTTLDTAKEASFSAIERAASTADFTTATDNALLAIAIDPEDKMAQTLVQRAARLPEIMVLLDEAVIVTEENNLDKAKSLYEQVLDIDAAH